MTRKTYIKITLFWFTFNQKYIPIKLEKVLYKEVRVGGFQGC